MEISSLKTFQIATLVKNKLLALYGKCPCKTLLNAVTVVALVAIPDVAFAQAYSAGAQFFCYIAQYFKYIVGTCALVALIFWAIEHIFGVAKLHDMVLKVGIACAIVAGGATLITNSGLTTNCILS